MSIFNVFNKGESTDNSLIVDNKGTENDAKTGDTNDKDTEVVQIQEPQITVQDPGGNKYHPKDAHYDIETGSWEAKEGSKIITDQPELVVEQEKQETDEERYNKFQDTGVNQRTDTMKIDGRSKWAKQYKEEVEEKAIHQEALDSNRQANEGSVATPEHSDIRKNFFTTEDEIAKKAREDAERERLHKEALDSNRQANEGSVATPEHSDIRKNFFTTEDEIAKKAREDAERERLHKEALDSNRQANEGSVATPEHSDIRKNFFTTEDEIAKKAREDAEQQSQQSELEYLRNTVTELTQRVGELTRLIEQLRNPILTPPPVLEGDDGTLPPPITPPPPISEDNNEGQGDDRPLRMGERGAVLPPLVHSDPEERARQQEELRAARERYAPEQISARLGWELAQLNSIATQRPLTDQEKIRWFEIYREKKELDRGIGERTEIEDKRRKNKEKIIGVVAGVVGAGIAIATPPVTVAAVIAVGFGGKFLGMGMRHFEQKLRAKSNVMKYVNRMDMSLEQIKELDKKQKRNEKWANVLGGAAAVVTGGVVGYGIGNILQSAFGWQIGGGTTPTPTVEPSSTLTDSGSNIPLDSDQEMIIREANKLKAASSGVDTAGVQIPPVDQLAGTGGAEGWVNGDTLDIKQFGWKWTNDVGSPSNYLALGPRGGPSGIYQDAFFNALEKLIPNPEGILYGEQAGDIVQNGLRLVGSGNASPAEAAKQVAEILIRR